MGPFTAAVFAAIGMIVMGLMIQFIALNMIVQCESWVQPECVTPAEFVDMYLARFK